MSRTVARSISWLVTVLVVVGVWFGVMSLPGSGGLVDEIRWLVRNGTPSDLNRASWLIRRADDRRAGSAVDVLTELLHDPDPQIVRAALMFIGDWYPVDDPQVVTVYLDWLRQASTEERIRQLPNCMIGGRRFTDTLQSEAIRCLRDDRRWLVAASLQRQEDVRALVEDTLFGEMAEGTRLARRLRVIDALPTNLAADVIAASVKAQPCDAPAGLESFLDDTIPEARWAAGRILAAAGDPRGLPALCEWLNTTRNRLPPQAVRMLDDLHGPDWRSNCASGSATSQPGAGDG